MVPKRPSHPSQRPQRRRPGRGQVPLPHLPGVPSQEAMLKDRLLSIFGLPDDDSTQEMPVPPDFDDL